MREQRIDAKERRPRATGIRERLQAAAGRAVLEAPIARQPD
jgi:ribosomal protein L34